MAVSTLLPSGGANDFNVSISGAYTSVTFDKEYPTGSYTMVSSLSDTTFDIYAYNGAGTLVGYTKTPSLSVSSGFNKLVILGGTTSDLYSFTYKTTYASVDDSDEVTAGPVATSASALSIPAIDAAPVITGRNFSTSISAVFTGTDATNRSAKSLTRTSATSLTVVRPDLMPAAYAPYSLVVTNTGVTNPTGSNSHILSGFTVGSAPVWVTASTVNITLSTANTISLSATATTSSSIASYTIVSGTLPTGLSLNTSTGAITGTPTTSAVTVTFRATDLNGSSTDKAILFNANPVWVTTALSGAQGIAMSTQLSVTDDTSTASIVYTITSGTLPTGITLTSGGLVSGTASGSAGTTNITFRATDSQGGATDKVIPFTVASLVTQTFTTVGTNSWTYPSGAVQSLGVQYLAAGGGGSGGEGNAPGGGGGAGGLCLGTITLTPGTAYSVVVGNGAANNGNTDQPGNNGGASWIASTSTVYANGGGRGGGYAGGPGNGGSGGGGSGPSNTTGGGSSTGNIATGGTAYGNAGGASYPGGGGGAGSAGTTGGAGAGRSESFSGSSYTYCTGGLATSTNGSNYGDGGGRGNDTTPGDGRQGIVILKYYA